MFSNTIILTVPIVISVLQETLKLSANQKDNYITYTVCALPSSRSNPRWPPAFDSSGAVAGGEDYFSIIVLLPGSPTCLTSLCSIPSNPPAVPVTSLQAALAILVPARKGIIAIIVQLRIKRKHRRPQFLTVSYVEAWVWAFLGWLPAFELCV